MHRARKRGLISGVSLPHSILLFPRSHREITLNQTRPHSRLDTATKPAVARCCEWYHDRVCILFSTTIPVDPLNPATDKRHAERVITWPTRRGWGPSEKWHRPARNNPSNEISYGFPLSFFFFLNRPREPEIPSFERTLHARARFCDRSISANTRNALRHWRKSFEIIRK